MLVKELADWLGLPYEGNGAREIAGVAPLETATTNEVSFAGNRKALKTAAASPAGCLVVPLDFENTEGRTVIRAKDPRGVFAKIIRKLVPREEVGGVHPTAVIGLDCEIGEGTAIGAYTVIGDRVKIGPGGRLYPNVTIYSDVTIGARAIIHSGAVIGADGFGFVFENGRYEKFPQVGRVEIGDDVEIGAHSAVDRAALGVTSIGDGTKLDNMVHIAHNCRLGRHVVIAAQTGMAGGTVIEDYAVIGGQVGMGDNVTVKSGVVIGSGAGILSSKIVRGGGEVYWGTPARPLKEYLEAQANVARLPELKKQIEEMKAKLEALEKRGSE